jgi:hypothetical protein
MISCKKVCGFSDHAARGYLVAAAPPSKSAKSASQLELALFHDELLA